ncbi:exosporium leader peptide-containing protein, partial [Bacillus tropicus]
MSYESENYLKRLKPGDFISAGELNPELVGPTLPPIPSFTLPIGPTGVTG